MCLVSMCRVDLGTFSDKTYFNTDLHEIAKQMMDSHNPDYKL